MPCFAFSRLPGSTPSLKAPLTNFSFGLAFALALDVAVLAVADGLAAVCDLAAADDAADPVGSNTICCGVTDPASGIATPLGFAGDAPYGNVCPLWRVRSASGSF